VVRVASAAEVQRARDVVRSQEGVRVAKVIAPAQSAAAGPAAAAPAAPTVSLVVDGGAVRLTGTVPSAAVRAALVEPPTTTFGAGNVDDQLTVDSGVGDAGLSGLGRLPGVLGKDAVDATVVLRDNAITLTGAVSSATAKQAAVAAAQQSLGPAGTVVDQLVVAVPPAAPTAAPTTPQVQQKLRKLPPITFLTGSATLTKAGRAAVAQAAKLLNASPDVTVRIEGHTDSTDTAKKNLALSRARAKTVLTTLRTYGVATDRMTSDGFGESRLKVKGTGKAQQAINRRVEFIVT
jgi:outer membrane protein OmpA-like peptidoglycan-associated protein